MVGRKTSPRCANCRQRKIKCDLLEPSCSQCIRSQWQCPGYDTHSRFHAYEKDHAGSSGSSTPSLDSGRKARLANNYSTAERKHGVATSVVNPVSAADRLRVEFVFKVTQKAVAARFVVIPEHQLLKHIPRRVGHSQALDDAVKCICSTGNNHCSPDTMPAAVYSEALCSLQEALKDLDQSPTSETLAAAVLLQMFEHSVDHSELRWLIHANGVIKMLEMRGPTQIRSELDYCILHAQVGNIFFNAIRSCTSCFLAEPHWLSTLEHAMSDARCGEDALNEEWSAMIIIGIRMPGLVYLYEQLRPNSSGVPPMLPPQRATEAQCNMEPRGLVQDLCEVRHGLAAWRERYQIEQKESLPRIRHASQLAVNVFSTMVEYMLDTVHNDGTQLDSVFHISSPVFIQNSAQTSKLAAIAKEELRALIQEDTTAAMQTCTLLRMMLTRVLEAPLSHGSKPSALKATIDDLYNHLNTQ